MKKSASILAALGLSAAALTGVAAVASSIEGSARCTNRISGFRQSVSWYGAQNDILVEADEACGSKRGEVFDLAHLRITIREQGKVYAQFTADEGSYWPKNPRLLVGKVQAQSPSRSCLGGAAGLSVDFRSGEIRSSGFRAFLSHATRLPCPKKGGPDA